MVIFVVGRLTSPGARHYWTQSLRVLVCKTRQILVSQWPFLTKPEIRPQAHGRIVPYLLPLRARPLTPPLKYHEV